MKFSKEMLLLYAVTDRTWVGSQSLYEQVEEAILGGVTMVQLREKHLSKEEFLAEAKCIKNLCHKYRIPLIINDDVDIALEIGADGVHVGSKDAPVKKIRELAGEDFIIGATAKTIEQAIAAEQAGADYLGVGAVFPSSTKQNALRISKEQLKEICLSVSIPAVAIGGICAENLIEIRGGGMAGVAMVSAIFSAENIRKNTKMLKEKVKDITGL
ncbi:MAG: thiamine phosphate synthase [Lachnospiraceae bacterium]|nr:thiamine phosphate synthase [Lachnospiraceae bacterium]